MVLMTNVRGGREAEGKLPQKGPNTTPEIEE